MRNHSVKERIGHTNGIEIIPTDAVRQKEFFPDLEKHESQDHYLSSPAYLMITGRRGSGMVRLHDTFAFSCAHPNLPSQHLLFYPTGVKKTELLTAYFDQISNQEALSLRIARVPEQQASTLALELTSRNHAGLAFKTLEEDLLDWRYPVHTLSTRAVSEAAGHNFKDFRKNLSRASRLPLTERKIDAENDGQIIVNMGQAWAEAHTKIYGQSALELAEPYRWLGYALKAGKIDLEGYIVSLDQKPVAFVLWEKQQAGTNVTSSLASLSITREKGVNEYLYWIMCRDLAARGIEHVCIGGSETIGLDNFKRKMQPETSLNLKSIVAFNKT